MGIHSLRIPERRYCCHLIWSRWRLTRVESNASLIKTLSVWQVAGDLSFLHELSEAPHPIQVVPVVCPKKCYKLCIRTRDHKDKRNFDAVLHITSDSVLTLLARITDAKGTTTHLSVIKRVVEIVTLKKDLILCPGWRTMVCCLLLHYWHCWLLQSPNHTLGSNSLHWMLTCVLNWMNMLTSPSSWLQGSQTLWLIYSMDAGFSVM